MITKIYVEVYRVFANIFVDNGVNDLINDVIRSKFWTAATSLPFELAKRFKAQNVGNACGLPNHILNIRLQFRRKSSLV